MIITAISKKNIRTYGKSFEISDSRIVLSINLLELSSKVEIIIKKFPYADRETYNFKDNQKFKKSRKMKYSFERLKVLSPNIEDIFPYL